MAVVVAAVGTATGWFLTRRMPRVPAAFAALAVATMTHYALAAGCATCALGPTLEIGTRAVADMPDFAGAATIRTMGLAYWSTVLQAALVLAILSALFSLLGAAQLLRPKDPPVDGNRLLRALGTCNVCSGVLLGLPVAILASPSRAIRQGKASPAIAMATYLIGTAFVFGLGLRWFDRLPMAAIAAAVFTSSFGLFDPATGPLLRQAWSGRTARRASLGPLAIATLVVAIGLVKGLAAALFIGALAAVCLLAVDMRRSVVVAIDDARTRRSRRVRPAADTERLGVLGDQVRIIVLAHWLYFGTADELGDLLERQGSARWLLLDLGDVAGVDLTAARSLVHAAERLDERGMHLVVAGLPEGDPRRRSIDLFRAKDRDLPLTLVDDLDAALERAEDDLLGGHPATPVDHPAAFPGLTFDETRRLLPSLHEVAIGAGDVLFRAGDIGEAFYAIRRGRLTLWIAHRDATRRRLLTFGDGVLFGELALLDRRPRSADAIADTDCVLWVFTRERLEALATADAALHAKVLTAIALQLAHRLRDTTRMLDLG